MVVSRLCAVSAPSSPRNAKLAKTIGNWFVVCLFEQLGEPGGPWRAWRINGTGQGKHGSIFHGTPRVQECQRTIIWSLSKGSARVPGRITQRTRRFTKSCLPQAVSSDVKHVVLYCIILAGRFASRAPCGCSGCGAWTNAALCYPSQMAQILAESTDYCWIAPIERSDQ